MPTTASSSGNPKVSARTVAPAEVTSPEITSMKMIHRTSNTGHAGPIRLRM